MTFGRGAVRPSKILPLQYLPAASTDFLETLQIFLLWNEDRHLVLAFRTDYF